VKTIPDNLMQPAFRAACVTACLTVLAGTAIAHHMYIELTFTTG
jgi:hypothetical protein